MQPTMRLKMISCEVLARQTYYAAALSPHVVDVELVRKGLHDDADVLRVELQRQIDASKDGGYDAILLGYGLCSNAIAGLVCPYAQMVVPRAHDCITLFLGSKERYAEEFRAHPGTYWYTADYVERGGEDGAGITLGTSADDKNMSKIYQEYVVKYGEDNADYLMEVMGAWQQHYDRAAYIDTAEMRLPDHSGEVAEVARRRGWTLERITGSFLIIRDLVEGRWDGERFLIVPPGETIAPTHDGNIISRAQL